MMGKRDENGKGVVLVYATFPEAETAFRIARQLVSERLIACGNVLPGVRSVFVWDGEVADAEEAVLIAKTHETKRDGVIDAITALHPYDVPAIAMVPVDGGHAAFLEWVGAEIDSVPLADAEAAQANEGER